MPVSVIRHGAVAVVTVDHPPVNALSRAVRRGLLDMVAALDADPQVDAVVLACAGRTFIAGADVAEFDRPPEPPHLPDVVGAIEAAAKPWVAAIHGSALGGGLEVALGCAARVATAAAKFGLPEVTLGIVPGAGGCTRTPRLVGMAAAIDLVTTGKPVGASKAVSLGLIDAVIEGDLVAGAVVFAEALAKGPRPPATSHRPIGTLPDDEWRERQAALAASARGAVAPSRALDCLRAAAERGFAEASAHERATFLDLRGSAQAAALRHVFFAERSVSRPPELEGVRPRPTPTIGIVGGGTMGVGIALAALEADLAVILLERDETSAARADANLRDLYAGAVKRGRPSPAKAEERLARFTAAIDMSALAEVDLVIEAVFEDLAVKREVFERSARVVRPDAILATNTSYLDPNAIFARVPGPERCLALHFFSPAHVMKLVEIVPCAATSPQTLATGFALTRAMGKIAVRAGICDGFIGNRILKVTRAQAERLLLAGATPARVDAAMRAFGLPMGPFEAQDLGGLDIAAYQRGAARARGETPFAPVADRLVALGRLGRKVGAGWYDYPGGTRVPVPSSTVEAQIRAAAGDIGVGSLTLDEAAIRDAILLPMIDEGAKILAEGIALRADDVDLVKIHGYGFPRVTGGPMWLAQTWGFRAVLERFEHLAAAGLAPPASEALTALAGSASEAAMPTTSDG